MVLTWMEWVPTLVAVGYWAAAGGYLWRGEVGWAMVYASYGTANIGLVIAAVGGRSGGD